MLLPVRLHQLGEEGCQILVLVLVLLHAGGAGCGVEVRYFPGTESLKFQIVKHDPVSVSAKWRCCPHVQPPHSRAACLSLQFTLDANGVLAAKHVCVTFKAACALRNRPLFPTDDQKRFACSQRTVSPPAETQRLNTSRPAGCFA